jgi:DNA polymerase III subunit epsilon
MRFTVWDTETTGFPVREGTLDQQPYIIQFAAITGDINTRGEYTEIERTDIIIKPRISIPFASSQVHGIYDRDVEQEKYIDTYLDKLLKILNGSDVVIWHNIEYDETVLMYELERNGRKGEYTPVKAICTMRGSTDHCKLPGRGMAWKPPKLSELHKFLFGEYFDGAHNAMMDVEATTRSFAELVKRGVIELEENEVMRLF